MDVFLLSWTGCALNDSVHLHPHRQEILEPWWMFFVLALDLDDLLLWTGYTLYGSVHLHPHWLGLVVFLLTGPFPVCGNGFLRFGRCFSAGVSLVILTSVDFFTDGGDVLAFFNCLTPVLTPESFCFHLPFYHVVPHIRPFLEVAVNRRNDLLLMACFLFKGFFSAGTSRSMPSSSNFSAWTNWSCSEVKPLSRGPSK